MKNDKDIIGMEKRGSKRGRENERERKKPTGVRVGSGKKSTRNSIKIGEICIVPRNVEKRRDVVERLRGNRNLGTERRKSEETR